MLVILHEGVRGLGRAGDVVTVKPGYARNYLIPTGLAIVASKANLKLLEERKHAMEVENQHKAEEACATSASLHGVYVVLIKQAGEDGKLFGSVTSREISKSLFDKGFSVHYSCVLLNDPIRYLGEYFVKLDLHHDVSADLRIFVVRNENEVSSFLEPKNDVSAQDSTSTLGDDVFVAGNNLEDSTDNQDSDLDSSIDQSDI